MTDLWLNRPFRLFAPAKVNLGLEVTGRRPDGYHSIVTLMETVSIFDVIDLRPFPGLQVISDEHILPEADLARLALQKIEQWKGARLNLSVRIQKHIPISAGLGGGSSDAGTLISAIGGMVNMPRAIMHQIACELGSDIPFFLDGGLALASGTGTDLEPIESSGRRWYLIVRPELEIPQKTASLYSRLSRNDFTDGSLTRNLASTLQRDNRIDPSTITNSFARVLDEYHDCQLVRQALLAAGARHVFVSGAGPSLFTICDSFANASNLARALPEIPARRMIATSVRARVNASRLEAPDS